MPNANSKKSPILIVAIVAAVLVVAVLLYISLTKGKSTTQKPTASPTAESDKETGREEEKIAPLPVGEGYEIVSVGDNGVKAVSKDKTIQYSKAYVSQKDIYQMVGGQKQPLTFEDLQEGQRIIIHKNQEAQKLEFEIQPGTAGGEIEE